MKNMSKSLSIILFCGILSILCISALVVGSLTGLLGDVVLVDNYGSIDDLIKDSPIIAIGTVDSSNNEIRYGEVTFALTKFRVETTVRGAVSDTINILQTKISSDPLLKKGDRMVLFLVKYEGPITEDAYRMKGLYQGQYKIEGTKIIKNKDNKLTGDDVLASIDTLISRINVLGYAPKTNTITSE